MARLIVGSFSFDMADWSLADLAGGTVTSGSSTEIDVTGAGGKLAYTLTGSGFTTFDANGFPTDGTVTGFTEGVPGRAPLTLTDLSISASDFMGFVNANDAAGLEAAVFGGDDVFGGRPGNDVLLGFGGNDSFNLTKGGNDTVQGGDGDDVIGFGGAFTAADSIDGGAGTDKVTLQGDYSAGVIFGAATMVNVEEVLLQRGHNYNLTFNAASDTAGQSLDVRATTLAKANHVTLDGSALAGSLHLAGGNGNDVLIGGSGTNDLSGRDGSDTIYAGTGVNVVSTGTGINDVVFTNWVNGDEVIGQSFNDTLQFDGDFTAGLTLSGGAIKNIAEIDFLGGHSYDVTASKTLLTRVIDGETLGAGDSLSFDASANSVTTFTVTGGAGDDTVILNPLTQGMVDMTEGGNDTVSGALNVFMGGTLTADDHVSDSQNVILSGAYSGLELGPTTLQNVNEIELQGLSSFNITTNDGTVAAGHTLTVALQGGSISTFTFDGSAETDGAFILTGAAVRTEIVKGGAGNDTITMGVGDFGSSADGGGGNDTVVITGDGEFYAHLTSVEAVTNQGHIHFEPGVVPGGSTLHVQNAGLFYADLVTDVTFDIANTSAQCEGGQLADTISFAGNQNHVVVAGMGGGDEIDGGGRHTTTYEYFQASDSTSIGYDYLAGYSAKTAQFDLWFAVSGVDGAVNSGALSTASFDTDLAAAVGPGQLGASHALIFTPDSGGLAGEHFLVIDANGTAGYQASDDLVIRIAIATGDGSALTTANFVTG